MVSSRTFLCGFCFNSLICAWVSNGLSTPCRTSGTAARPRPSSLAIVVFLSKSKDESGGTKEGYRFGDFSRFLAKQATDKVNELTGKSSYELGDLSRWLDGRAKERVQAIKGQKGEYKYEVGDLTRWADALVKERAAQFAGKETAQDYQVGDISRTLIRKVRTGEYNLDDVFLALRVLAMAGYTLLPVARLLPIQALIPLINVGLANDIRGRLTEVLATSLDARVKEALTGNANYQLGDIAKDRLRQELARFTGKDTYSIGDLSKAIVERGTKGASETRSTTADSPRLLTLPDQVVTDLASWDASFLESQATATKDVASWDKYVQDQSKGSSSGK
jgi:hypothetical protein